MKLAEMIWTSCLIVLLTVSTLALADISMQTAMANCREEAISTGLVDDTDVTAYVDLCMQAWQSPADYTEWQPGGEDQDEMHAEPPE